MQRCDLNFATCSGQRTCPGSVTIVYYQTWSSRQLAIYAAVATRLLMDLSAVNTARAVSDHGVDSLIAAELRNWFHLALGSKISMVDLLDPQTSINALAAKLVDAAASLSG